MPIALPEGPAEVVLNADAADAMRVEISDRNFKLLPAFSGAESGVVTAKNGLECVVEWPSQTLAMLAGEQVRFRVRMSRRANSEPRLYAVYIRPS